MLLTWHYPYWEGSNFAPFVVKFRVYDIALVHLSQLFEIRAWDRLTLFFNSLQWPYLFPFFFLKSTTIVSFAQNSFSLLLRYIILFFCKCLFCHSYGSNLYVWGLPCHRFLVPKQSRVATFKSQHYAYLVTVTRSRSGYKIQDSRFWTFKGEIDKEAWIPL